MGKAKSEILRYLFFGACTTGVNWVAYYSLTRFGGRGYLFSTIVAWILAVLFAFVTNKFWVFNSTDCSLGTMGRELGTFMAARLFSGGVDLGIMWLGVDVLGMYDLWVKIAAGVVVILLNYILSKRIIFRKGGAR
jgi:putative flippase GtrA